MGIGKFVKAWRWTSGMTQMQYLADMDASIGTGTGYSGVSDGYFATIPYFAKTFNGTEEIIACHEQLDPTAPVNSGIKNYIERWTTPAGSSTSSPQVYPYTGFTSANDDVNFFFDTPDLGTNPSETPAAGGHESRLAVADNGSGTVIGFGANMTRYNVGTTPPILVWDINGQITTGNPGTFTIDPVGGGMIVSGSYRQWINGALAAVNANGQVLGLQNSTSPVAPAPNTLLYNILPDEGPNRFSPYQTNPLYPYSYNPNVPVPYYAYNDPASVPYPVIWVPQTSGGTVTGYTLVTLTMPQAGMSFTGAHLNNDSPQSGLYLNKNLQIAGGRIPNTFSGTPNYYDAPFLWQNFQYHHLSDFFPALSNYAQFKVTGLDDSGTVTALATPSSPANASQQILQLCPVAVVSDPNNTYQVDNTNPVLTYVRFGLWDHAFDNASPPNVLNGNAESANFVGSDSRRFYIRIYDPSAVGNPATVQTVTADWFTQKPGAVDDDHPATDTVTLTESAAGSGIFASKALMLVTNEIDNAQSTNTGLTGGGNAAEGAADHRLRRAALGDMMCYSYTPRGAGSTKQTFSVPIFGPTTSPDVVKTMTVQVANLYQGKSFTQAQSDSYIQAIQANVAARWAVAGIKVNFKYAYGTPNDWVSISSTTGIDLNSVESGDGSLNGDEGKLATIVKGKYSNADPHTIFLILIQQFAWDIGGTPGNYTQNQGEAFSDGEITAAPSYAPSLHCSFVARLGLGNASSTTCVPPHELGHQVYGQTTADLGGNGNHYDGAQQDQNLMRASAGDPTPGSVTGSRRLWDDPGHVAHSHNYQIDYMRQSELLQ